MGSHFASTRPDGLRRLVLANAAASKEGSLVNRRKFRKQLPQDMQEVLARTEAAGTWDSAEVGVVMQEFYRRHACTVSPLPEDLLASMKMSNEDKTVVKAM